MNQPTIIEWKRMCIDFFRDGQADDAAWQELADKMLWASENGDLSDRLEKLINPEFDTNA